MTKNLLVFVLEVSSRKHLRLLILLSLTRPNILPDFPRMSSKLSAFFFCGMRLLPVLRYQHKRTDKKPCNTRHISWDSSGIFCPLNVGFASWHVRSKTKKSTLGGKEHNFLSKYGYSMGCPNLLWRGLWFSRKWGGKRTKRYPYTRSTGFNLWLGPVSEIR